MARMVAIPAFLITLAAASAAAIAVPDGGGASGAAGTSATTAPTAEAAKKPLRYEDHELFIETNATDGDAGLQQELDGEDWRSTKLRDKKGRALVDVRAKGKLRNFGLTELFFEAAEPSFDEFPFRKFKKRFPEGKYTWRGQTVEGRKLVGSDRLSHLVPDGPVITFPTEGAQVDPDGFTITWEPVTTPAGVEIVRYIVIVDQETRSVELELDGSATSADIPGQVLEPGTELGGEVLAKDRNGQPDDHRAALVPDEVAARFPQHPPAWSPPTWLDGRPGGSASRAREDSRRATGEWVSGGRRPAAASGRTEASLSGARYPNGRHAAPGIVIGGSSFADKRHHQTGRPAFGLVNPTI